MMMNYLGLFQVIFFHLLLEFQHHALAFVSLPSSFYVWHVVLHGDERDLNDDDLLSEIRFEPNLLAKLH